MPKERILKARAVEMVTKENSHGRDANPSLTPRQRSHLKDVDVLSSIIPQLTVGRAMTSRASHSPGAMLVKAA